MVRSGLTPKMHVCVEGLVGKVGDGCVEVIRKQRKCCEGNINL